MGSRKSWDNKPAGTGLTSFFNYVIFIRQLNTMIKNRIMPNSNPRQENTVFPAALLNATQEKGSIPSLGDAFLILSKLN